MSRLGGGDETMVVPLESALKEKRRAYKFHFRLVSSPIIHSNIGNEAQGTAAFDFIDCLDHHRRHSGSSPVVANSGQHARATRRWTGK